MKEYTLEEWLSEGEKRFGKDKLKWKFKCPMCGHIASVEDFKNKGSTNPNDAYLNCIGRFTGKGSPKKRNSSGCNWAAYGLFGIPKGGVKVNGQHIFDFAEVKKKMKKNWYELSNKGKCRRLNEAYIIADADCLTDDFWQAYDQKDYDRARKILIQNNNQGGKIGYHYSKNYAVNALLM